MIGKRAFRIVALALALGLLAAAISRADTPWSNLLTANHVEADPNKPYTLKEDHGPWIIMACSFNGQNAQQQAHDLVLELRKNYRMEAFVYRMDFKLDDPNGNAQSLFASPHRHEYQMVTQNPGAFRDGAIKEIAVVVGNFPAVDDPEAQKALQKLKAADPTLPPNPGRDAVAEPGLVAGRPAHPRPQSERTARPRLHHPQSASAGRLLRTQGRRGRPGLEDQPGRQAQSLGLPRKIFGAGRHTSAAKSSSSRATSRPSRGASSPAPNRPNKAWPPRPRRPTS